MTEHPQTWRRRTIVRAAALMLTLGGVVGLQAAPASALPPLNGPSVELTVINDSQAETGKGFSVDRTGWADGVSFSYEWYLNGALQPTASGPSWGIRNEDVGRVFRVVVTGRSSPSDPNPIVREATETAPGRTFTTTGTPTVSGTAAVGQVLVANPGTWDAGVGFAYQWLRGTTPIADATQSTYTVAPADMGQQLAVRVSGTKAGYTTVAKDSASTATVPTVAVVTAGTAAVGGTARVGETLTASATGWDPEATLSYQWLRNNAVIAGATAATYVIPAGDLGQVLRMRVTGTRSGYASTSTNSSPTAAVASGNQNAGTVTVTGTPRFGETLTATTAGWASGATLAYQWLRNGTEIDGATSSSYATTLLDIGLPLSVRVTGTKAGYADAMNFSVATSAVAPAVLTAGTVAVSGTPRVGQALTATPAGWPSGVALSYQWLRSGTPIAGATGASYTPVVADLGAPLAVQVTAVKAGYTSASAPSSATAAVGAATLAAGSLAIAGSPKVGRTLSARPSGFDVGTAVTYRWLVGTKVVGTQSELKLTKKLAGKKVVLQAVVTKAGYETATVASAPVKVKAVKKPGKKGRGRG